MLTTDYAAVSEWLAELTGCAIPDKGSAIGKLNADCDEIVAGVMYENYTGASVTATIAVTGGKASKDFLAAIFDYPFEQLGVKKIFAFVSDKNERSKSVVQRAGFVEEGRIKDYYDGADAIVFACYRETCRWLTVH
jgi:RimJ/RimL family protein N-acetyltransferase